MRCNDELHVTVEPFGYINSINPLQLCSFNFGLWGCYPQNHTCSFCFFQYQLCLLPANNNNFKCSGMGKKTAPGLFILFTVRFSLLQTVPKEVQFVQVMEPQRAHLQEIHNTKKKGDYVLRYINCETTKPPRGQQMIIVAFNENSNTDCCAANVCRSQTQ